MSQDFENKPPVTPPASSNPYSTSPDFSNQHTAGQPVANGPATTSGKAIASLVLGIGSFFCSILAGIPALVFGIIALGDISKSNGRLTGRGLAIAGIVTGSIGSMVMLVAVLIGMLLPAVQQVRTAARRTMSLNNIRQLTLSMHNYESALQHFPNSKLPQESKGSGLSWRVHILPQLGHEQLYDQFHRDEPWDSPHNLTLVEQMPEVFINPNLDLPTGETVYCLPTTPAGTLSDAQWKSKTTMFVDHEKGISFGEITDGSSNTIAIVEVDAAAAVNWTQPTDWEFDPASPTRDLGGNWFGGQVNVGMGDGSSHSVTIDAPQSVWQAMFTRAGGEDVGHIVDY